MTQEEIIELARRAGFNHGLDDPIIYAAHERFAKLVALRYQKKIADLENIICQRHWDVLQEREALEAELLKLKKGIASNSDYIQGRWDLIGEFQDVIRARGGNADTM